MNTTIIKSMFFSLPREIVWSYLTDKDKLGTWYHPAEADLEAGKNYSLYKVDENNERVTLVTGRVIEMKPPSKLVTTFVIDPFQGNETTVTWELHKAAGGTRLSLSHEGIAEATGEAALHLLTALDNGWDKHLADLRTEAS